MKKKSKMLCVTALIIVLSSVIAASAISLGGGSLLEYFSESGSDTIPEGTATSISADFPTTQSANELVETVYAKEDFSFLGIGQQGEILNLNSAPRSLTAINQTYPMECIRMVTDSLLYSVYRVEDNGLNYNMYLFFQKVSPEKSSAAEGEEIWWLSGRVLYASTTLSHVDFAEISVGSSLDDVASIDPMALKYKPADLGPITVQDFDVERNTYLDRTYVPELELEYKSYHMLTDGILCIMFTRNSAAEEFVVSNIGFNENFEIPMSYTRGTMEQGVALYDYPAP